MVYDSDEEEELRLKPTLTDEHLIKLIQVASKSEGSLEQDISLFEKIQRISNSKQSAAELQAKYLDMTTPEEDKNKKIDYEEVKLGLCEFCYMINCELHPQTEVRKKFHCDDKSLANDEEPCGADCYKLIQDVAGVSHLNQEPWTIADSSLFKITYRMLGENFCTIAKCINGKTCKMVHNYAQIPANLPVVEEWPAEIKTEAHKKKYHIKGSAWLSKKRAAQKGMKKDKFHNTYVPCNCVICDKDCQCFENYCEKFCQCPDDCIHRFRGCQCKQGKCKTNACPCWNAARECDSDICKCIMPFPKKSGKSNCFNCATQLGKWKRLMMKPSMVVKGYGCFIKESAKKGEFITVNRQVY